MTLLTRRDLLADVAVHLVALMVLTWPKPCPTELRRNGVIVPIAEVGADVRLPDGAQPCPPEGDDD
jgi:hypothetical protein